MNTEKIDNLLSEAIAKQYFPSVAAAIGCGDELFYKKVFGYKRVFSDGEPCFDKFPFLGNNISKIAKTDSSLFSNSFLPADIDTLYDMASLTKIMTASIIALRFIEEGFITLYDTVGFFFEDTPADKKNITILNLMTHTSGITAHFYLGIDPAAKYDPVNTILKNPLSYKTGTSVEYSCIGYILLGKILEKISGKTIDVLAQEYVLDPLGMKNTYYNPQKHNLESNFAVTEYNQNEKKYICGIVHDENARFLGGVSSNAGLFSCINDCIKFASMLSKHGDVKISENKRFLSEKTFDTAIKNHTVGLSNDRGLGFQLKGEGISPMGDLFSYNSFGHTGFTGTSIFVDRETGLYTVLLTNRVHYTRASDSIIRFRRVFCNAAISLIY